MNDLSDFVAYSDRLLNSHLTSAPEKYINFRVSWNNDDYQVHYVLHSKTGKTSWEMMAYAKVS